MRPQNPRGTAAGVLVPADGTLVKDAIVIPISAIARVTFHVIPPIWPLLPPVPLTIPMIIFILLRVPLVLPFTHPVVVITCYFMTKLFFELVIEEIRASKDGGLVSGAASFELLGECLWAPAARLCRSDGCMADLAVGCEVWIIHVFLFGLIRVGALTVTHTGEVIFPSAVWFVTVVVVILCSVDVTARGVRKVLGTMAAMVAVCSSQLCTVLETLSHYSSYCSTEGLLKVKQHEDMQPISHWLVCLPGCR